MFNDSICAYTSKFDCHEWRKNRLWNEECDIVFKYYLNVLKGAYEKFSGRASKPGQIK
jgi:hypothetical protein